MGDHGTGCAACLDSRDCWLCYGTGQVLDRGRVVRCLPCDGSGRCAACVPVPQQRRAVAPSTGTSLLLAPRVQRAKRRGLLRGRALIRLRSAG